MRAKEYKGKIHLKENARLFCDGEIVKPKTLTLSSPMLIVEDDDGQCYVVHIIDSITDVGVVFPIKETFDEL